MSFPPAQLKTLAESVASLLIQHNATLSVAETACGGLISASLLSVPGSSKFYRGGVTLYTLESRIAFGGWQQSDIEAYRGPTQEIVVGLASHVRKTLNSTFCLAESGTAGPTGGKTPNRTPGYCAIALVSQSESKSIEINTESSARNENQVSFALHALELIKAQVESAGLPREKM